MYPHRYVNLDEEVDGGQADEGPGLIQLVDPIVILKYFQNQSLKLAIVTTLGLIIPPLN